MVILCIHLELDAYILWGLLLIWGILHYVLKQEGKEIYQSTVIFSIFGIYAKSLIDYIPLPKRHAKKYNKQYNGGRKYVKKKGKKDFICSHGFCYDI